MTSLLLHFARTTMKGPVGGAKALRRLWITFQAQFELNAIKNPRNRTSRYLQRLILASPYHTTLFPGRPAPSSRNRALANKIAKKVNIRPSYENDHLCIDKSSERLSVRKDVKVRKEGNPGRAAGWRADSHIVWEMAKGKLLLIHLRK